MDDAIDVAELDPSQSQIVYAYRLYLFLSHGSLPEPKGGMIQFHEYIKKHSPAMKGIANMMAQIVHDGATQDEWARTFISMAAQDLELTEDQLFGKCREREVVEKRRFITQCVFYSTSFDTKEVARLMKRSNSYVIDCALRALYDYPLPIDVIDSYLDKIREKALEDNPDFT